MQVKNQETFVKDFLIAEEIEGFYKVKKDILVYKKTMDNARICREKTDNECLTTLLVKENTRIYVGNYYQNKIDIINETKSMDSFSSFKCRVEEAIVVSNKCIQKYQKDNNVLFNFIFGDHFGSEIPESFSYFSEYFSYIKGNIVKPHLFSKEQSICSGGIHVFIDKEKAYKYNFK